MSFIKNKYWPRPVRGFFTRVDQSKGLMALVMWAVGPDNLRDLDPKIMLERQPLVSADVRELYLRVEPLRQGETIDMAVNRLVRAGHKLEGTGELAGYLQMHPGELQRWRWVFAARQKMWMYQTDTDGNKRITGAFSEGKARYLWRCFSPDIIYSSPCGILVSTPAR